MKADRGSGRPIILRTAPCPAKLQRRIVRNLQKMARQRFHRDNAKKARTLLDAINSGGDGIAKPVGRGR